MIESASYDVRDVFVETLCLYGEKIDIDAAQLVFSELTLATRECP